MDPLALRELMPDFLDQGFPANTVATEDAFWYMTDSKSKFVAPITPPPLRNKGKYIVSV